MGREPDRVNDGVPSYSGMPGKLVLFRAFYGLRLTLLEGPTGQIPGKTGGMTGQIRREMTIFRT
jgi:hypothetical protein